MGKRFSSLSGVVSEPISPGQRKEVGGKKGAYLPTWGSVLMFAEFPYRVSELLSEEPEKETMKGIKRPTYIDEVIRLALSGGLKPGTVSAVTIAHDDWCDLINGRGGCNCDPDLEVKKQRLAHTQSRG